jgi:hypothetical protein
LRCALLELAHRGWQLLQQSRRGGGGGGGLLQQRLELIRCCGRAFAYNPAPQRLAWH